jgi:mercuric ion binding protein
MNPKALLLLTVTMLLLAPACAQSGKKTARITIKSSVVCGQCQERVESGLAFEKGVRDISVDLDKKEVTVTYNPEKTTPAAIRKALSKLGYDADEVKADPKAYEQLPYCCKTDSAPH